MLDFTLSDVVRWKEEDLNKLEKEMEEITGKENILHEVEKDIKRAINDRLSKLGLTPDAKAEEVVSALTNNIGEREEELYRYIGITKEDFDTPEKASNAFEKVKEVAYDIISKREGFFLKKEKAEEILRKYPPEGTIEFLGYGGVDELLEKEDLMDIMSALRFTESKEWMHQAFDVAYSDFTPDDFEHREVELRMLGPQWEEVAKKFVEKKHHNVSHLKEFGVIFLNPINQTDSGAFLRDFALFFHYFHEIAFYSDLFEHHSQDQDFAEKLKAFLRGDVPEKDSVDKGEWLIVQRYLWKIDPNDPRLFLPRVNPESLHWHKGEQDLVEFGQRTENVGFDFWDDLDWVGGFFSNKQGKDVLISFDLEDNAMSYVEASDSDDGHYLKYHQQEAVWNEIFKRYVGSSSRDKFLVENFHKGSIKLSS